MNKPKMTQDDFDKYFRYRVHWLTTDELLSIPGIWEILAEELNNDVIEAWELEHMPDEPEEDEDDD